MCAAPPENLEFLDFVAGPELASLIFMDRLQGEHKIYCGPVQSPLKATINPNSLYFAKAKIELSSPK